MMDTNELTYKIRGILFKVHTILGLGLLESVYEAALMFEFSRSQIKANSQVGLPVIYEDVKLEVGFRLGILVENTVIIEVKSVEVLYDVHKKQLLTYLKLSNKKIGFLVNFNAVSLIDKQSLIRIIK